MSDHPNVETVKLMMEAIFSQDHATLAKIFTDDFVFHFRAPYPRSRHHRHPTRVVSPALPLLHCLQIAWEVLGERFGVRRPLRPRSMSRMLGTPRCRPGS